jgi:hypothetical protein
MFYGAPMPKGWGLYYDAAAVPRMNGDGVGLSAMVTNTNDCVGGTFLLGRLTYTTVFSSGAVNLLGNDWLYRPGMIITHDADVGRALAFSWRHGPGTREWAFNGPVRLIDPEDPNDADVLSSVESEYLERFRESELGHLDEVVRRRRVRAFEMTARKGRRGGQRTP